MDVVAYSALTVLGVPAAAFFIVALAIGLNPVRSAAWGAICGFVACGAVILFAMASGTGQQASRQAPASDLVVDCSGAWVRRADEDPNRCWVPGQPIPVAPQPAPAAPKRSSQVDPAPGGLY
jgi:hypothetical protein